MVQHDFTWYGQNLRASSRGGWGMAK